MMWYIRLLRERLCLWLCRDCIDRTARENAYLREVIREKNKRIAEFEGGGDVL